MRYHYDNSAENTRNPSNPPRAVQGGNQAIDEMSHLWLQVLPAGGGDQRAKLQEALVTQRLEKYPDDFGANFTMGDLLLTKGNTEAAAEHFGKASKADPRSVLAATEWGIALFSGSRLAEAEAQFKRALDIDPSYTDARFDLASVEASSGEWEPAAADFRRVMEERPDDARARQHLGEVLLLWGDALFKAGKNEPALARYRDALQFRPDDAQAHGKTGMVLAKMARLDEAQAEFETALRIDPKSEPARQTLEVLKMMKK
jgi:tetratricopeptide (TPR) repeat protein